MPKNLRKRGRIWWYRIQKDGRQHEGSLETTNLGVAVERLGRVREELKATKWGEQPKRTFNEAVERFVTEHFGKVREGSGKRYAVSIRNLLEDFNGVLLDDIGSARLIAFEERRRAQKVSPSTIRRDLACLSVIFSKAQAWEWIRYNPVKPFLWDRGGSGLKEGAPRERYLSVEEEALILAEMPEKAARAAALAIDTGLRKREMVALLWTDVNFRARQLRVRAAHSKNAKARLVPLLPRTLELLVSMHRQACGPHVFTTYQGRPYSPSSPYFYEALQRAVRRVNKARAARRLVPLEHVEWHDLRRTCGCRLLQERGFSMEEVCKWLGHSSVKVTERHYAFLRVEQLHRAVERSEARVIELDRRLQQHRVR